MERKISISTKVFDEEQLRTVESVEASDPFTLYLKDIRAHSILSAEEEVHYIQLAQKGDTSARNHMVNSNLRLVIKMARRFLNRGLSISDLVSEGNFGLFTAIKKFKPTLGYKFSTYATWWITQALNHAVANKARTIRIPIHSLNVVNKFLKASREIPDSVKHKTKKIAETLNMPLEEARWIESISIDTISYDTCSSFCDSSENNQDYPTYKSKLIADEISSPEQQISEEENRQKVSTLLDILTEQERDIIFKRYGFESGNKQTLETISKKYKRTRERIRQIQDIAMDKLKKHFKENNIDMASYL